MVSEGERKRYRLHNLSFKKRCYVTGSGSYRVTEDVIE